ncbi:MAG: hypothetical protein ACR2HC_05695 [Thermoleophilaceae bacterium]
MYVVLTFLLVPGTIPSVAAGALFGPLWVGIVPGTIAFVVPGSSIADPRSPGFIGSLAAVIVLIAISSYRTRRSSAPPAHEGPRA